MIALLLASALASDPGVLPHTAGTLPAGEAVARLPTGRSGVGLTDRTELWVVPFDLGIGGPRVGTEHGLVDGDWSLSLRPSVGVRTTGRRASLRLEPAVSRVVGSSALSAELGVDLRFLQQLQLETDGARKELGFDRLQSTLLLAWDHPHLRAKVRLPLRDRGETLRWGSGSVACVHRGERVQFSGGLGMLVGRPKDQFTLGTYAWWFWLPYPELDLVVRLGKRAQSRR